MLSKKIPSALASLIKQISLFFLCSELSSLPAPVSDKLVLGKAGGLVLFCFGLGSHNYMYKAITGGLPTPYIIDHSGFLLKIPIYFVCVEVLQTISLKQQLML